MDTSRNAVGAESRNLSRGRFDTERGIHGFFRGEIISLAVILAALTAGCRVEFSPGAPICGNRVLEEGEMCDGDDFGGKSCADWSDYVHGDLLCTDNCTVNLSLCHTCGNGKVEGPEECDGENLVGETCETLGGTSGGNLSCNDDCTLDLTGCEGLCGNKVKEEGEACDGEDYGGDTCESIGLGGGELGCNSDCTLDVSGCEFDENPCGYGLTWCAGSCVDTDTEKQHCGRCGNECEVAEWCFEGTCVHDPPIGKLSIVFSGLGTGTVELDPGGIICGDSCNADFSYGTDVTIRGFAETDSEFAGWSGGGCAGVDPCTITITQNVTVTAMFVSLFHELEVNRTGDGYGRVYSDTPGIDCGVTCTATLEADGEIVLSASPAIGSSFSGWSGGGCSGTGSCTVIMSQPLTVTAQFTETHPIDTFIGGGFLAGIVESPSDGSWALILAPHNEGVSPVTLQWRGTGSGNSVEGGSSLWNGYSNTYNMPDTNHPAASFCRDLSINSHSDWYLPAPMEWQAIFDNWNLLVNALQDLDFSGEVPGHLRRFWSSHEVTTSAAVLVNPIEQTVPIGGTLKTASHGVFAVRRIPF